MSRARTWFVDVDGTVIVHLGSGPGPQWYEPRMTAISDTVQTLSALELAGDMIILVTARPEHNRRWLEQTLAIHRVPYHRLIMGVTAGQRILVNDAKPCSDEPSCLAIEIERNVGLKMEMIPEDLQ